MIRNSENLNLLWARAAVEECLRNGIDFFCISPGSRSTPLTIAAAENSRCRANLCFDERGAAYMALGYAKASGKPAALICTSGTALANYFPAVVEAAMDDTPMLLLTADRPPELQESGANQTINQQHIYGDYARWFFNFEPPGIKVPPSFLLNTIDLAIHKSLSLKGPVHLNFMFREPLEPTPVDYPASYADSLLPWFESSSPYTFHQPTADQIDTTKIKGSIRDAKNGLIVVGKLSPSEIQAAREIIKAVPWPCFADVTSGLRIGAPAKNLISYFDLVLLSEKYEHNCKPDLILHLGGRVTSKRFLQFLQRNADINYIQINDATGRIDPAGVVKSKMTANLRAVSEQLKGLPWNKASSLDFLKKADQQTSQLIDEELKSASLSDPAVARSLSRLVPQESALFLSNSMPVRDMDMFADGAGPAVPVGSNRGASGIDGILASSVGFAAGLDRPVTCLIGDLAFLHDLNSLYLVKKSQQPIIVVLINNGGGGIFHFLPIAQHPSLFPWFETPHEMKFAKAAELFELNYARPQSLTEFEQMYKRATVSGTSWIIEILTDKAENKKAHNLLNRAIKEKLSLWLEK